MREVVCLPWIERFGALACVLWFIFVGLMGVYGLLYPTFELYLDRLRDGHQVRALQYEEARLTDELERLTREFSQLPEAPPEVRIHDWFGGFPTEVTVTQVEVRDHQLDVTVRGSADALWNWLRNALPSWGGLALQELAWSGNTLGSEMQLRLTRQGSLRVWATEPDGEVNGPLWGPLSDCPALQLVSRVGRSVRLMAPTEPPVTLTISDWLTPDWQLIHVSGHTLQWRSRLGTLCTAAPERT